MKNKIRVPTHVCYQLLSLICRDVGCATLVRGRLVPCALACKFLRLRMRPFRRRVSASDQLYVFDQGHRQALSVRQYAWRLARKVTNLFRESGLDSQLYRF